jgi:hypothetical protein
MVDFVPGPTVVGIDFAAGGDDNAMVMRVGNRIKFIKFSIYKDVMVATGWAYRHLVEAGYKPGCGWLILADATGVGQGPYDRLRELGLDVQRFNFGGATKDMAYKNEGARAWHEAARQIKRNKIICPDPTHPVSKKLFAQLTSRRQKPFSDGRLGLEPKDEMRARGVSSPDIADAFVMAFSMQPAMGWSWLPYDDTRRQEIARAKGWLYTSDEPNEDNDDYADRRNWNRSASADSGIVGFGGVNSQW